MVRDWHTVNFQLLKNSNDVKITYEEEYDEDCKEEIKIQKNVKDSSKNVLNVCSPIATQGCNRFDRSTSCVYHTTTRRRRQVATNRRQVTTHKSV